MGFSRKFIPRDSQDISANKTEGGEQPREFSTLSTITEKKDNYIEIPAKRSFDIEEPEEDSEEYRHRGNSAQTMAEWNDLGVDDIMALFSSIDSWF